MVPSVTLFAALAAIASPLVQAVPVPQALAAPQQNCAAALILAQGISENIEDQKNEQAALAQVVDVLNKDPVDANAFAIAKANLLTFVNNGIAIRQANQLITPLGNKATEGLAIVADAQLDELNLSLGLTGDPAKDADAINKLNDGFASGLKQNEQNLADATDGCVINNGALFANGTHDANLDNNNKDNNLEDNKDEENKDEDNKDEENKDEDNKDEDNKDEDNKDEDNKDEENKDEDNKDEDNKDEDNKDEDNKAEDNKDADAKDAAKEHEAKADKENEHEAKADKENEHEAKGDTEKIPEGEADKENEHEAKADKENEHANAKDADKKEADKEDSCDEGSGKEEADKESDKNAHDAVAAQEDACN